MSSAPATLETTEADVLAAEVSRLRAFLEDIRDIAAGGASSALRARPATTANLLTTLSGLASDALEQP